MEEWNIILRRKIIILRSSSFIRNVMTLATGTALSQALTMAFSPLITRLYGPELFGLQSIFMTVVAMASTVAAMNYPTAMVLPKTDNEAKAIARLSLYLGFVISLIAGAGLHLWGGELLALLNAKAIFDFKLLIPISMMVSVAGAVLSQWLIRKRAFLLTARYGVMTSLIMNGTKVGLGLMHPAAISLIVTNIVGGLVGAGLTYLGWRKHRAIYPEAIVTPPQPMAEAWGMAKAYRDFPLFRTPQVLINSVSQGLPVMLLASVFGAASAGHYAIALTVLATPAALIGNSVMSVFLPRFNDAIHHGEDVKKLVVRATSGMSVAGGLPFALVLLAGPAIFAFVFGAEWRHAGVYAQLLAPWLFLQFINRPAVAAVPALRLQRGLLGYELFSTGSKVAALWVGFQLFKSDVVAVALFSLVGSIAYIWLIYWVIRRSSNVGNVN